MRLAVALCAAFLALTACGATASAPAAPGPDAGSVDYARDRTVRVDANCDGEPGREGWGSGVVVSSGTVSVIATAAHVVDDDSCEYTVWPRAGKAWPADVHSVNAETDVALLVIDTVLPAARLAPGVELGDAVMHVGWPAELIERDVPHISVSRGTVSTFIPDEGRIRVTGLDVYFGSSGGPVFDEQGRVVGLAVSMAATMIKKSDYVTPSRHIAELLHAD